MKCEPNIIIQIAGNSRSPLVWIAPPGDELVDAAHPQRRKLLGIYVPMHKYPWRKDRIHFGRIRRTKNCGLKISQRAIPWWSNKPPPAWVKFEGNNLIFGPY